MYFRRFWSWLSTRSQTHPVSTSVVLMVLLLAGILAFALTAPDGGYVGRR